MHPHPITLVVLQVLLVIAMVACGLWVLYLLEDVVLLLILATLFAHVIAPLVRAVEIRVRVAGRRRHLPRAAAIVVVYVVIGGLASAAVALLLPSVTQQISDGVGRIPGYTQSFRDWEHGWSRYYDRLRIPVELRRGIDESVLGTASAGAGYARASLTVLIGAAAYVPSLVLIPVLAFFLLKDAGSFQRILVKALPRGGRLRGYRLLEELNDTLAAYIRAQLLACVVVGILCGLGFAILGEPYPIVLGILAGVLEFIPLLGPFVVAVIAAGIAAFHGRGLAVEVASFLAILRMVEDYVIYPRLIGHGIHLHPVVVVLAVLAGMELRGVAGIFIAVPTVAMLSVAVRHWLDWRGADTAAQDGVTMTDVPL